MVRNYTSYGFSRFISMNKLNISNLISIQENMTVFNSNNKITPSTEVLFRISHRLFHVILQKTYKKCISFLIP